LHVVYVHPGVVAKAILMDQELDAHSLTGIGRHVHILLDVDLAVKTLMEDCLQDVA
jgi:hypothetical protein